MSIPDSAFPGQPLAPTSKFAPGPGTYQLHSKSIASLLGTTSTHRNTVKPKSSKILTVQQARSTPCLPNLHSVIHARITRIERQQARCHILVVSDAVAAQPIRGIIRSQDVRATEKEKVKLVECFRVGDIVHAVVVGLGDQQGYFLSTAGNEYGVVMAWSEAGNTCVPISWCEVKDQLTGLREARKVAKPV